MKVEFKAGKSVKSDLIFALLLIHMSLCGSVLMILALLLGGAL